MKKYKYIGILTILISQYSFAQNVATPATPCKDPELKTLPVLWQQTSAEYKALCYQAFNLATIRLDQIPKKDFRKKKLAIITDIDETILDNSPNDAQLVKECKSYSPDSWKRWTDQSAAVALPGAATFLQYAHERGVSIFYISNRDTTAIRSTMLNLQKLNLPNADKEHMLFLTHTSSKEERRKKVMEDYEVVLLLGDNLGDFTSYFDKKPINERAAEADKLKQEWGRKFIVLPNATYGEWENAVYDYKRGLSPEERDQKRKEKLKGY